MHASGREGITLMELAEMFPDEGAARAWFEELFWSEGRSCPQCGSQRTHEAKHTTCPYRCTDCRSYFSVKTGTAMQASKVPLRKWAFAIYLEVTSLKGISSRQLSRDIGVTQKTAWFMLHRLRESWAEEKAEPFAGPLEIDETYMGGREKNKHANKKLRLGRGGVGKTIVVGTKDRATSTVSARTVRKADRPTLHEFLNAHAHPDAIVYSDEASAYHGMAFQHETVVHSRGEYVAGDCHVNGIESFWALLKRGYMGTYHHYSPKHMDRYVAEFAGRLNDRESSTLDQMIHLAQGLVGKRLTWDELTAGGPAYA